MCKKIAECLIEQRKHIEYSKQTDFLKYQNESLSGRLEKIYVLIEFLKKKISYSFDQTNLLDSSISESVKNINYFLREAESKTESEDFEIIDANQVKEGPVENEKKEEEEEEDSEKINVVEAKATEALKEIADKEAKAEEKRMQQEILERKRIQEEAEKEHERKEKIKQELELKLRKEYEAQLKKEVEEMQVKKEAEKAQLIIDNEQNEKVLGLIQTMRSQKWEHTRINIDILKEQFNFIKDQLKQANFEIAQISRQRERHLLSLGEFRKIVLEYDKLCDIKSFTAQFNVFYWLFQQQPSMGELFLKSGQLKFNTDIPDIPTIRYV